MNENEDFTITIPKTLVNKLRENMKNTNFTSLTQYVISLIRKLLAESEEKPTDEGPYTEEEEKIIQKRLRDLGYID